ncbi:MAG: hypothetical protein IT372_11450 [Polyangiaceae bacterium]|nr:hypothetical protein [Polyangiaceae bacterium]
MRMQHATTDNVMLNHVAEDRPDVVVVMEITNDIGVLAADGPYRRRMGEVSTLRTTLRWPQQKLSSVLAPAGLARRVATAAPLRPGGGTATEGTRPAPAPGDHAKRLRAFVAMGRAFGAKPVLMTQPLSPVRNEMTPPWGDAASQEAFNEVVRQVGAEQDAFVA